MKKALLKAFTLALVAGSLGLVTPAFAIDPSINAVTVSGSGPGGTILQYAEGTAVVNFSVTGTPTLAAGAVLIQISFPLSYYPDAATAVSGISGPGGALFNWTYDEPNRTLNGTSNVALADGAGGLINITVRGRTVTASPDLSTVSLIYPGGQPMGNATGNDTGTGGAQVVTNPSPVTLIDFNAVKEANVAILSWGTSEETNSDRFEIEHSLAGKNWQKIGTVAAKGESKTIARYLFTDTNPANGSNLYRIRMVDKDGTFEYTRAKSLEFDIKIETALYPNPVADRLLIKMQDMSKIRTVSLVNLQGKVVLETNSVPNNGLDVMSLPTGLYVVQVVNTNGSVNSFKIMKN